MKPDLLLRAGLEDASYLYNSQVGEAENYLAARGIPLTVAMDYRLGVVTEPYSGSHNKYVGRLSIPYITRAGVVTMRFRCLDPHDCKAVKCAKYLGIRATDVPLYNVNALFNKSDRLIITEGELDALVCSSLVGVPAVGCPGSNGWKPHFTRAVADFHTVVVIGDGDSAGREMVKKLEEEIANAVGIVLPEGHDINSLYLEEGPTFVADLMKVGV